MTPDRRVYLLDPQKIPPETIAVTFAKTSRSPQSFSEIASELTNEKSAEFHEKWVVGYGHASVAEHAVLHIALENISRLAVETLESNRLASYTEKSTRYQKWDPEGFYTPPELQGHLLESLYGETLRLLFDTYRRALPAAREAVARENPRGPEESEGAYERRIRSSYVDACRYLLPAASLANVGVTINARALEHAISKMLTHPLEEVREMGDEVKAAALEQAPTLVKYAAPLPHWQNAARLFQIRAATASPAPASDWCRLVDFNPLAETLILAAGIYHFGEISMDSALDCAETLSEREREKLGKALLGDLGKHDEPVREMEYSHYTFDVIMDQGAYFEIKRHRMMTQTAQALTTRLGYAVPRLIAAAGMEDDFRTAMDTAALAYEKLAAFHPEVASYVVPNGFNRRVLLSMNLRSALHFIRLRTAPNAHFSVRRVAGRIGEEIAKTLPLFGPYVCPEECEDWREVEAKNFIQVS